ncbi:MAG TPA: hypothetical protein PLS07_03155 [Niabella sp.]|nr:hypothetical protein [Niabella sp.]HQW14090.1 hypothetical protein [Niabella sp.]HQX19367.1 hypothetical protein [Niabella sp.]HQX41775.1 hypothetical protein [Niabella sp.]HRB05584.1 hypothetical protein [Niabella sp.]
MSLNEINLSPYLVTQLYPKSLVGAFESSNSAKKFKGSNNEETPEVHWKSLGNNKKKVLVVVQYPDVMHLPDEPLEFLVTLLKACKLSLVDIVLINMHNYSDTDYSDILSHFDSRVCLLFGLTTSAFGFPFEIPAYQVQQFSDYTVIHAPQLQELQKDKNAKGLLWTGLKNIFNL